jgi:transposase
MPYPYAEARLLHVYGLMHAQKGGPEPARERLEAALALFRRLGARKDADARKDVQRTGCRWVEVPGELGDDATAHRRRQRWQAEGIWPSICQILGLRADPAGGRQET